MRSALACILLFSALSSAVSAQEAAGIPESGTAGAPRAQRGGALAEKYQNRNIAMGSVSVAAAQEACQQTGYDQLVCLANGLLALVTPELRAQLLLSYSVENAEKWSNFPPLGYADRLGPTLGDFSEEQLGFVKAILIEAAGIAANEGYDEIEQILNADDYLLAETGELGFSSSNFQIAFLGTPGPTGTWELQFGGHHTAVANTYVDGVLAGATPSFRGVEPFGQFEMNGRTNDPMSQEQAAFAAMLTALTPDEQESAMLAQTYTDVVVGPQKDDNFPAEREGIQAANLTDAQQDLVLAAIETYVMDIDPNDAKAIMEKYEAELDETYVAFSGTPTVNQENDYVRIDGPSVWIEFSMQPGRSLPGIHPHSIWRDRESDYAGNN